DALDQVRAAQQQIVHQARLNALGQMASGIAHDFNNALSPIVGFSDLLLQNPERLANRDLERRYLEMIRLSAQDAGHIVHGLREFYRRREPGDAFVPIHLKELVKETVELTAPRWKTEASATGKSVRVATDLGNTPLFHGNATELREALTNLIFNAVDALPQGG